ncbi:MAG: Flp pilus assembly complex ATPase component TadA [Deltaproteobacteria bacterium]|nr:Flp pilus assembly complex ATPase component TadA [Deltaproteobacteria bacterium]
MRKGLLGEILVETGALGHEGLASALAGKNEGERIGEALVRLGLLSEGALLEALSAQYGVPRIKDDEFPETPPGIDGLPIKFLKHYRVAPIRLDHNVLTIAAEFPVEPYALEALKVFTGFEVDPVIASGRSVLSAIDAWYGGAETVEKIIEGMGEHGEGGAEEEVQHLKAAASGAPVINLVNLLIEKAVERRASDIHMEPFEGGLQVRYRIDGVLYPAESLPSGLKAAITSRIKIMARLNIAERRLPQDGRFKVKASGREMDVRVSTVPTLHGESVVLRLLDPTGIISLEAIGFSPGTRRSIENLIRQPHGMILATGPTGSGKTTTLYAALSRIDSSEKKVITIEDPVEYNMTGINQIQVKPKIGFTFANGLRSIVRQDPDVIMVGEIRDAETAEIAIHSALTGHLILSTMHTNDAAGAITRLLDMGVEGYLISSCLLGVLAQRLVRVVCGGCSVSGTANMIHAGNASALAVERLPAQRGAGCELCGQTGYRGRTVISELMPVSDGIRSLISGKHGAGEIARKAREEGMTTLKEDGLRKASEGITTLEEVARVTLDQ